MPLTEIVSFDSDEAVAALREGQVVAFPTETVYGLGVVYDSKSAFDRLVEVKKRPPDKPFTLMGGSAFVFEDFACLNDGVRRVIKAFVPGPLTLLLKPKKGLARHITLSSPAIGIRISGSAQLRAFIDKVGKPLLVPSANKSGHPPLTAAADVYKEFKGEISYVIDGPCAHGLPSTIVDFSAEEPKLIRQGDLNFAEILSIYENKGGAK